MNIQLRTSTRLTIKELDELRKEDLQEKYIKNRAQWREENKPIDIKKGKKNE